MTHTNKFLCRESLLWELQNQLKSMDKYTVADLQVIFYQDGIEIGSLDFTTAFHWLVNHIYASYEIDISCADTLNVETY